MSWRLWGIVTVIVAVLAGSGVWHVARWIDAREDARQRTELANAKADADTLRLVVDSLEKGVRVWERRAHVLTDETRNQLLRSRSLERRLEEADREARVLASMYAEVRDDLVVLSTAVSRGDSTVIPFEHADEVFTVSGSTRFPGTIRPDPEPPTRTDLAVAARVRALLSVSCEEKGGDPHAEATTFDSRVTIRDLAVAVADDVACWPDPPSFGDLLPNPSIGNLGLAALAFAAGLLLGN